MALTAVGHEEVIKMHYFIGLGDIDSNGPDVKLADTTSFTVGVSLSEIKWGFHNSNEQGDKDSAYIEFTLHDIAGTTFKDFLRVRGGFKAIFFKGPDSSGAMWGGEYAKYKPIPDQCQIEFSQTQGFTYRFCGEPLGNLTKSLELAAHSKVTINGLDSGNFKHSNTWADHMDEFASKWNTMINSNEKKGTANITFNFVECGAPDFPTCTPYLIERDEEGNPIVNSGHASSRVQQFDIAPGTSVSEAVQRLWQLRFAGKEVGESKNINAGSMVEVNFEKYEGGLTHINLKLHRKAITDAPSNVATICVGDDKNCAGATYRGQLTGIDFGGVMTHMATGMLVEDLEEMASEASNQGNTAENKPKAEKIDVDEKEIHYNESTANIPYSPDLAISSNTSFGGFSTIAGLMNKFKHSDLSVEVELPYSYGFSAIVHGGILPDCVPGQPTGMLLYTAGAFLNVYWYTTPLCDKLALMPIVSNLYRITSVIHTIGLSGNTTQIKLSLRKTTWI